MEFRRLHFAIFTLSLLTVLSCKNSQHVSHHDHDESHGKASTDEVVINPEKAKVQGIESQEVQKKPFSDVIEVAASVENTDDGISTAVANVPGQVSFVSGITAGSHVSAGQPLFRISSDNFEQGNALERVRLEYENALSAYDENRYLYEKKVISLNEFLSYKSAYEKAKLSYDALRHGANGQIQVVKSPISGYVDDISVSNGEFVDTGQELASIVQTDRLYLKAEIPQRLSEELSKVKSARIRLTTGEIIDLSDMDGKIVARGMSSSSYYIPFAISFKNPGSLVSGQKVDAYLIGEPKPAAISVPLEAVVEMQGLYFTYVQKDNDCYERRQVTLGQSNGSEAEILAGLSEGDRVVVKGARLVRLASASNAIPAHTHSH